MYDTRQFEHDGKEYEVRIASDGHTIRIRVFQNNKPANGYVYSVELLTQIGAKISGSIVDPVEDLIKTAITDVKSGQWERYVAVVSASTN